MRIDIKQDTCCASDDTGTACRVPVNGQPGCHCASQAKSAVLFERPYSVDELRLIMEQNVVALAMKPVRLAPKNKRDVRRNIGGILMLGIACITSPCCMPFVVPAMLALLAGTPVAVWLAHNVGWVYGGLTLVSLISMVLGLRWIWGSLALHPPAENRRSDRSIPHLRSAPTALLEDAGQPLISRPVPISGEKSQ